MDYQQLGALIGSAWRDNHPNADPKTSIVDITKGLDLRHTPMQQVAVFSIALQRTMKGQCYGCGTTHEVGRNEHGVFCCEVCVGQ